jgi:hypothetical protein
VSPEPHSDRNFASHANLSQDVIDDPLSDQLGVEAQRPRSTVLRAAWRPPEDRISSNWTLRLLGDARHQPKPEPANSLQSFVKSQDHRTPPRTTSTARDALQTELFEAFDDILNLNKPRNPFAAPSP